MRGQSQSVPTTARHRNRATKACTQCRKSRVRCVLNLGSNICTPCQQNQLQCAFDDRDGRKCRASVKTVEAALTERIRVLERQLEQERATTRSQNRDATETLTQMFPSRGDGELVSRNALSPMKPSSRSGEVRGQNFGPSYENEKVDYDEPASSVVTKLMPSSIRFDMASGRVRYFGSTTHMNVLTKVSTNRRNTHTQASHWPIALILKDLCPETHDYLMGLFWSHYNSIIRLVDQEAYHHDQESGGAEYYSTFLHLAMLGTGFRYADKARSDIQRLAISENATSSIHEKTKALGKQEIERPGGGIPSIQALQLLSGLEFCCGNDDTGWMFSGMCFRMVYDAGLHIDPASLGISGRDAQIRHMVLWACLTADRLWSLYLGRPTTLKTADISPSCLSYIFEQSLISEPSLAQKDLTTRIYEALLQMMERVGQLCDLRGPRPATSADSCFQLAAIGQQLRDWYSELPQDLKWSDEPLGDMPPSYFLLHTQYNAALILLHRPFMQYHDQRPDDPDTDYISICRKSCAASAESIAIILEKYRARFELAQVFGTAVQHAGTAATAMMGEVVIQSCPIEISRLIERLSSLKTSVSIMSRNYQGAGLMVNVIDKFIRSIPRIDGTHQKEKAALVINHATFPQDQTVGQASAAERLNKLAVVQGPAMMANPFQQRWRVNLWSNFTSAPFWDHSPSGLPFLPSSFWEDFVDDDFNIEDTVRAFDSDAIATGAMNEDSGA